MRLRPLVFAEYGVAGGVSESVVDSLEVVDVEHQYADREAVSTGRSRVLAEPFFDVPSVGEAGEGVGAADEVEFRVAIALLVLQCLDANGGADARDQLTRFEGLLLQ